ncbi:prolipoprotein diacylglyceryl transferase [Chloroflexota bacterium]
MPILFYLPGELPVYTSSILIGIGGTLGMAWIAWRTPADDRVLYLDVGLWALLGALIGGRLAFVLTNWSYFQMNTTEIPLVYLGGFSWPGALLGGLSAIAITAVIYQLPFGTLTDAMLPLLGTISVSAWLGCWLNGCAYGQTTDAWWGLPAKDEWGIISIRAPLQLFGALLSASLIGILIWGAARRVSPGVTTYLSIMGLSAIMLLISFLRVDPSQRWLGLRFDSWAAITLLGLSWLFLLVAFVKRVRDQPNDPNQRGINHTQPN